MAIWSVIRSRTIVHHLSKRVGFLGLLSDKNSWTSSLRQYGCSSAVPLGENFGNPATHFPVRFKSTEAAREFDTQSQYINEVDDDQALDFPGGKVAFTTEMSFISESADKRVPCYRVLDGNGEPILSSNNFVQVGKELAVKMYNDMVTLQVMDTVFYEAQRQGRISFYLTTMGEEALNIATAAALTADDLVLPQYREPGVLLWRGFTLQDFANQCFGNMADTGKARQMPIHYVSKNHNYFAVSSPIATQLPQSVGVAYSLKMDGKKACAVAFTGDGGTRRFPCRFEFRSSFGRPSRFIVRNNGWAISTPTHEQFRSDGLVVRGRAYGIRSIRVDGNDALAVYNAVQTAREMAISEQRPILVEAMTYRVGHHSTSDDSTKYRPLEEIEYWKNERNSVNRFRKWIERNGWWSDTEESELRSSIRKQVLQAIQNAEKTEKPNSQTCSLMSMIIHHQTFKSRRNYLEKTSGDIRKTTHLMFLFRKS
ncbi:hypothetical protein SLA2020_431070 [Shorea laevis]